MSASAKRRHTKHHACFGRNTTLPPEPVVGFGTNLNASGESCARARPRLCSIHRKNTAGAQPQTLWRRVAEPDFVMPFAVESQHHFVPMSFAHLALRGNRKTTRTGLAIRGKILSIFHGIDISSREVLRGPTPEYQQLFRRGDLSDLPIGDLWAHQATKWAAPRGKNRRIAHGRGHDAL